MLSRLAPIILLPALALTGTGVALATEPAPAPNPDRPAMIRSTELREPVSGRAFCGAIRRQVRKGNRARAMLVRDLRTGRNLCATNPNRRLSIASNTKLYTTAAALARSGPARRVTTRVHAEGQLDSSGILRGRLYLRGAGDPSLGSGAFLKRYFGGAGSDIERLARQVRKAGIKRITGRVIGDDSVFDRARGTAESGFVTSPWVGPLSGLSFNAGYTDSSLGRFSRNPARLAAETLTRQLRRLGVAVPRGHRMGVTPKRARSKSVASLRSPNFAWIARITNVYSNNFFAEMLVKRLSARGSRTGTTARGSAIVRSWAGRLGAPANLVDGSGLSRSNQASPKNIVRLLARVRRLSQGEPFIASLATAGRDGTLVGRMRGTAAEGRCRAKTGTLTGVSALSGYCRTRSGRQIGFSVLMNAVTDIYAARRAQDRIAARIAGL